MRNPVLVVPVLVVRLFQLPPLLLQSVDPLFTSLVSIGISALFVFVTPFVQGGVVGMADESLRGRTRLGSFLAAGRAHYVSILVAYLLLLVVGLVLLVALLVVSFVGSVFVLPHAGFPGFALGVAGLFFLVALLSFLLFVFFVQFYAQAIVLDDEGAMGGIERSVGLVRRNLPSTLGYTLVGAVVGGGPVWHSARSRR